MPGESPEPGYVVHLYSWLLLLHRLSPGWQADSSLAPHPPPVLPHYLSSLSSAQRTMLAYFFSYNNEIMKVPRNYNYMYHYDGSV